MKGAAEMKQDGVSVAFDVILEEIHAVEAQLKHEGALAFRQSSYDDAERLSRSGKELSSFREKLEALQNEWRSVIDLQTRNRVKVDAPQKLKTHQKAPKTNIRITMGNGRVIQRPTAAQAIVDAIEMMGVAQVRDLGLKVSGVDLVGTQKHPKYGQNKLGEFLICTHSNTKAKKDLLEQIAKQLGEKITVEIIKK